MVVFESREGGWGGGRGRDDRQKGRATTLNGFCAPVNEEYLGFVSEISSDSTSVPLNLLRLLGGKVTFMCVGRGTL